MFHVTSHVVSAACVTFWSRAVGVTVVACVCRADVRAIAYLTALSAVASEPALISKIPTWLVAVPIRFSSGTVAEAVFVALVKTWKLGIVCS
jgi:hypothetical protein